MTPDYKTISKGDKIIFEDGAVFKVRIAQRMGARAKILLDEVKRGEAGKR